jgi:hypothetical protein
VEQAGTRDRQTQPAQPGPGTTPNPTKHEIDHAGITPVDPGLARIRS